MSIRLRFTLLYSGILALMLILFGVSLYSIQARSTFEALKQDLRRSSGALEAAAARVPPGMGLPGGQAPPSSPPMPFESFSSDQAFQKLPEREIARVLDAAGNLIASPFGSRADALPLSEAGLETLQAQQEWWETAGVQDQRLLIYSRPVVVGGQVAHILQVARPLTERDRSLQALAATLSSVSLITLLLAFGIGWIFSGFTLQPIQRITQTARTIGEERDFTRRVDYQGPQDEVGELATTFNSMLVRLQDAYQRVAHALEMQRDFVADVSHELRTPLTTLRGNLGLLNRTPAIPAEEQADILSDMVDESDRLIRLVNDLLVLARADAGRGLAKEPLEIFPVLEEVCRQARQLAPQRQIRLEAGAGLTMVGDRDAFKQVLLIALDNALKHSDGEIVVTAEQQGAQVKLEIQDVGAGISPEKLAHVFDRFYRATEDSTLPGFGLGLPIAKALVEGQDGAIKIESELGKGSRLVLHFRAGSQAAAAAAADPTLRVLDRSQG